MKSVNFNFKGMMFPAFTPFTDDKKHTVNYDMVDKYAQWIKSNGAHGVMVNGYTGEGLTLRVEERKRLAEEWLKAAHKHQLTMLLQIGGADVADVYDLAEHAEKIGVDAVLVLPPVYYRPSSEEDLVHYMREVAQYAPSRPLLYYHIPMMTDLYFTMRHFADLAERDIPNFTGIYYAHGNLAQAVEAVKPNRTIIFAHNMLLAGAMVYGFEAFSMIGMNIMPEMYRELYEHMRNMRLHEAKDVQDKMFRRMHEFYHYGDDVFMSMKMEFNKMYGNMKMGPLRKPAFNINKRMH